MDVNQQNYLVILSDIPHYSMLTYHMSLWFENKHSYYNTTLVNWNIPVPKYRYLGLTHYNLLDNGIDGFMYV